MWSAERTKIQIADKEDNKTVSLTTSKINYMDPRISVAFCKSHDCPIEKVRAVGGFILNSDRSRDDVYLGIVLTLTLIVIVTVTVVVLTVIVIVTTIIVIRYLPRLSGISSLGLCIRRVLGGSRLSSAHLSLIRQSQRPI